MTVLKVNAKVESILILEIKGEFYFIKNQIER